MHSLDALKAISALNNDRIRQAVAAADPEREGTASLEEAYDKYGVQDGPDAQAMLQAWSGRRPNRYVKGWKIAQD